MKTLQDIKRELLTSPAAQAAYEAQAPEIDMARELIAARSRAGLTQSDVVQRYAQAVGARAVVRVEPQAAHT